MISAGDFRNGVTFEEDGNVLQVIEFQHVKPGKGAAFVRTKTKNVITGSVVEKSYNPSAKYPTAYIERKEMTYSYNDEGLYYFMDNDTFEMIPVSESDLSDNFKFVKETKFAVSFHTKVRYLVLNHLHSLLLKLQKQSLALRATQLLTHLSLQRLKQVQKFVFLSSLTKVI